MYNDHSNVGFTWRFRVQTGLVGALTIYFIIALAVFLNQRRRLKYGALPSNSRSTAHFIGSLIQAIFVVALSAGLLYTTVPGLVNKMRTALVLPFIRGSSQDQSSDHDYARYDPKDLFDCPPSYFDEPLTHFCNFDQSTIAGGAFIGTLAIFEALLVFIYQSRSSQSSWRETQSHDFEHSQPLALESYPKADRA
ncbi:hypothetical protein BGX27_002999 [Mortierella sp. AM989]|nr:hypothetical protein BGX27_002999 [Mortierella sp. AM989]